jgi:hypothetical protein
LLKRLLAFLNLLGLWGVVDNTSAPQGVVYAAVFLGSDASEDDVGVDLRGSLKRVFLLPRDHGIWWCCAVSDAVIRRFIHLWCAVKASSVLIEI